MAVPARIRTYSRILFAVALFGILVVTHLSLQIDKGFADGCAGLGATIDTAALSAAPEAACAAVATGEYKDFLGVSNILWGLGFYLIVALLRLGFGMTGNDTLRKAAFGVVAVGFLYTLRLVYLQAFVIGSFCVLCMMSALTVTVLLILHVLEHRKLASGVRHSAPPPTRGAALVPYGAIAGVFVLLLGADFALAGGGGGDVPSTTPEADALAGRDTRVDAPAELAPALPSGCAYDPQYAPLGDLSAFMDNPSEGSGSVSVIEVFDPNCPHCRDLNNALKPVVAANLNTATFYSVAFPLRQPTVAQAAALVWAEQKGKYFEFKQALFERQDASWGMSQDELRDTANSVGLDGPSLIATLNDQAQVESILASVQADATAVQEALTIPGVGLSTPKLIIGGRVIAPTNESYSENCLNQFIAEASSPASAPAAVVEEVE
ncbi:vitamin K epoxide reductase family protein [Rubricoccus marinus]|uniref:Vitamin K epoxide reductase domain-containing protein n=1 Tax=Rubricoccus marinus TaxID=716817 RepID=A0A259TX26_9BACT|nr:vitamin K epoxide reductase family protein [Rubricoccus marinus]OZC02124.1 hypothetical protein BSZ36_03465 [Rubricoccus marinus]